MTIVAEAVGANNLRFTLNSIPSFHFSQLLTVQSVVGHTYITRFTLLCTSYFVNFNPHLEDSPFSWL